MEYGAGREFDDGAVLHAHGHPPRQAVSDVAYLAILGSRNGFHVVRPFPPRLERGHADVTGAQVDQVDVPVPGDGRTSSGASNRLASALLIVYPPSPYFRRFPR